MTFFLWVIESPFLFQNVATDMKFSLIKVSEQSIDYSRNAKGLNEYTHGGAEFSAVVLIQPFRVQALFEARDNLVFNLTDSQGSSM